MFYYIMAISTFIQMNIIVRCQLIIEILKFIIICLQISRENEREMRKCNKVGTITIGNGTQ